MQFSEKLVWESVYAFMPNLRTARMQGVDFNLPSVLKSAAVEAFMRYDTINPSSDEYLYACIIRRTLKELQDPGWMTFGHINNIEGARHMGAYN